MTQTAHFRNLVPLILVLVAILSACSSAPAADATASGMVPLSEQAMLGKGLYQQQCATCHSLKAGTRIVGPSLAGVAGRASERVAGQDAATYLRNAILEPGAYVVEEYDDVMPTTLATTLSPADVDALVAFMLTLN